MRDTKHSNKATDGNADEADSVILGCGMVILAYFGIKYLLSPQSDSNSQRALGDQYERDIISRLIEEDLL